MDKIALPERWKTETLGQRTATFRNDTDGVEVTVEPRSSGSRHGRKRRSKHFRVALKQDWFSRGLEGDIDAFGRTETFEEALALAEEFIREYTRRRPEAQPPRSSSGTADLDVDAETLAGAEVAARTLTAMDGYSHDRLVELLRAEVGGGLRSVVAREGDDVDVLYVADGVDESVTADGVTRLLGQPPVDKLALEAAHDDEPLRSVWIAFDSIRVFRFVSDSATETVVTVDVDQPIQLPHFERTVRSVLSER